MDDSSVAKAIEGVGKIFEKNPDIFLTESDIKSHLFAKLLRIKHASKLAKTEDGEHSIPLHSEIRWLGRNGNLRFYSDIVLIDASKLRTKDTEDFPLASKAYGVGRFSFVVEIKLRRRKGADDNAFLKSIEDDIDKFRVINNEVSRDFTGYLIVFDKLRNVRDKILQLNRDRNIVIRYYFPKTNVPP